MIFRYFDRVYDLFGSILDFAAMKYTCHGAMPALRINFIKDDYVEI